MRTTPATTPAMTAPTTTIAEDAATMPNEDTEDAIMAAIAPIAGTYPYYQNDNKEERKLEFDARIDFMDGHNESASALAKSMFPHVFTITDDDEYNNLLPKINQVQEGNKRQLTPESNVTPIMGKMITHKLLGFLQVRWGLQLFWNKTSRTPWEEDLCTPNPHYNPQDPSSKKHLGTVVPQRFLQKNLIIHLFCKKCYNNSHQELVAVCKLINHDTAYKKLAVDLKEIFYHARCHRTKADVYRDNSHFTSSIDVDLLFGDTYKKALFKLNGYSPPNNRWDKKLSTTARNALKKLFLKGAAPTTDSSAADPDAKPSPPGAHINLGMDFYDYDDRTYCFLPCHKEGEFDIDLTQHKMSMARVGYLLAMDLGVKDFAPFLLDRQKLKLKFTKKGNLLHCGSPNPDHHLFLKEISLLFGGHEMRVTGQLPVHQWCHTDCTTLHGTFLPNDWEQKGRLPPGSLIIPLEDSRSVYGFTPASIQAILKGFMFVFRGDFPHGGITTRSNPSWNCAIHGHIDSKHLHPARAQAQIQLDFPHKVYRPVEHTPFLETRDIVRTIVDRMNELETIVQYVVDYDKRVEIENWRISKQTDRDTAKTLVKKMATYQDGNPFPQWTEEIPPAPKNTPPAATGTQPTQSEIATATAETASNTQSTEAPAPVKRTTAAKTAPKPIKKKRVTKKKQTSGTSATPTTRSSPTRTAVHAHQTRSSSSSSPTRKKK
jgi:hypothetical protein